MRIIGDIHGSLNHWEHIIADCDSSVQVGDFGYGFSHSAEWYSRTQCGQLGQHHRFIRGNHDDPAECKRAAGFISDGTVEDNVMYIGGAWSIDWRYRTPFVSWWPDEEISEKEWRDIILPLYGMVKPDVMITHDGPLKATNQMFVKAGLALGGHNAKSIPTRTGFYMDRLLEIHKPKFWFYGHWHITKQEGIDGTVFQCVGENQYVDFDMKELKFL